MRRIENHCRGCAVPAYPCMRSACPYYRVEVVYCDECEIEIEDGHKIFVVDGKEICQECYKELTGDVEEV